MQHTIGKGLIARRNPNDLSFWHLLHESSGQKLAFRQSLKECREIANNIQELADWTANINGIKAQFSEIINRPAFLDGYLQADKVSRGTVVQQVISYGR